jgi:hypothetical protein
MTLPEIQNSTFPFKALDRRQKEARLDEAAEMLVDLNDHLDSRLLERTAQGTLC